MHSILIFILLCAPTLLARPAAARSGPDCAAGGTALQVLGSGGPIADDARAGTAYLLWRGGRARVLVDAGSGAALRFGEAGARIDDLELLALTHFHTDHAGDVPALVKSSYFSPRRRALPISGPDGRGVFPGLQAFLERSFGADTGSFAYLSGALTGGGGQFPLAAQEVDASHGVVTGIAARGDLRVEAIGVDHGPVPALAYRVEADGVAVVFSGDQTGQGDGFWTFARGADLLVMHHAIPAAAGRVARRLHATPAQIGRGAAAAEVGGVLLSHFMARSLAALEVSLAEIRGHYRGPVTLAEDLLCLPLSPAAPAGSEAGHDARRNLLGSGADVAMFPGSSP